MPSRPVALFEGILLRSASTISLVIGGMQNFSVMRAEAPEFHTNPEAQIQLKLSKVHCYHYHVDIPHFPHLLEILPDVSHRILLF